VSPPIQNNLQAKLNWKIYYKCPANLRVCVISIQCWTHGNVWSETTFQYDVGQTDLVVIRRLSCGATVMVSMQTRRVENATHSATMNNS
jgi:hypothetical protein